NAPHTPSLTDSTPARAHQDRDGLSPSRKARCISDQTPLVTRHGSLSPQTRSRFSRKHVPAPLDSRRRLPSCNATLLHRRASFPDKPLPSNDELDQSLMIIRALPETIRSPDHIRVQSNE